MKKLNTLLMCVAAAAMTFTACSDADDIMPNEGNDKVVFIAENPSAESATRAYIGTDDNGRMIPMWMPKDELKLLQGEKLINLKMDGSHTSPLSKASFVMRETFDETNFNNSGKDFYITTFYGVSGNYVEDQYITYSMNAQSYIMDKNMFTVNDMLISEKMSFQPGQKVFNVQLKRLNGVICLKIADATQDKILDGHSILNITMSTSKDGLAGKLKYDLKTGTCEVSNFSSINLIMDTDVKIGDEGFNFSVLPISLEENSTITMRIKTKDGYIIEKTLTIGNRGFVTEAGKRTTMKVNVEDKDITTMPILDPESDVTKDPVIEGNVINMKPGYTGRLTSKMVVKAIGTGTSVKITGDINAYDWNSVIKVANGTEPCNVSSFTVDLKDANIKGGDGSQFERDGSRYVFDDDNVLPRFFYYEDSKISELTLPASMSKMCNKSIISGEGYLKKLVITKKCSFDTETVVKASPSTCVYFLYDYVADENANGSQFIMPKGYFLISWEGHTDEIGGFLEVYYCDKDGNPVQ